MKFIVCACALRCAPLFEKMKRRRHWFFLCVLNTASLELIQVMLLLQKKTWTLMQRGIALKKMNGNAVLSEKNAGMLLPCSLPSNQVMSLLSPQPGNVTPFLRSAMDGLWMKFEGGHLIAVYLAPSFFPSKPATFKFANQFAPCIVGK